MSWNSSTKMRLKRAWNPCRTDGVVAHEIPCSEEQVEEVERPGSCLQLVVAIDRAAEVGLQQGGEIGVRVHPELIETRLERDAGREDALPRDAVGVRSATAGLRVREVPLSREIDERRFPAVVVRLVFSRRALQRDLVAQATRRLGARMERVVLGEGVPRERGELVELRERPIDLAHVDRTAAASRPS